MPFLAFVFEAVLISLSGVMAPGPVTAVTIGKGNKSPHAGAFVALGHGAIEIPLMISILYGLGYLLRMTHTRVVIALVGGVFLLTMGLGMFRSLKQVQASSRIYAQSPVVAGILLSLGNPYFLVWWATVGATLIIRSVSFGTVAFFTFAMLHWLCDFFWCYFLSALSFKGGQFFGKTFQRVVFAVCGVVLLLFGGRFIMDAIVFFLA